MDSAFQELLQDFLLEARERLDTVEELLLGLEELSAEERPAALERTRRELHTLKGNSGMMGFGELQRAAHQMEDEVEALDLERPDLAALLQAVDRFRARLRHQVAELGVAGAGEEGGGRAAEALEAALAEEASQELAFGGVRVPFGELDALVEMLAEVLLYRTRLADASSRTRMLMPLEHKEAADAWDDLTNVRMSLEKILDAVQERVLKLRMVPLQSLFRHLNRIVHDEAQREGKKARLETRGGDTPLDKALLELASEALGHLVRNAVIHGIESPQKRGEAGKAETGTVRLSAFVHGQEVHIQVDDDGGGLDLDALRRIAKQRQRTVRSEEDLYALLFEAGVSTREGADLSAGRGIGLSAVAESVRRRGGRIEVSSHSSEGTRFLLRLPLSVSITRAVLFRVDGEEYALPLGEVVESLRFRPEDGQDLHRSPMLTWRQKIVPLVDLGVFFETSSAARPRDFVILVEALGRFRAIFADEITGIHDIVVKGLDNLLGTPAGISGSTILGDGRVILILDPPALAELASGELAYQAPAPA